MIVIILWARIPSNSKNSKLLFKGIMEWWQDRLKSTEVQTELDVDIVVLSSNGKFEY